MSHIASSVLESLISPRSVALIGASEDESTFSGAPLANILRHGFGGTIYPINPRRAVVRGLPCYPTLTALPEVPQTAVVTLGADRALEALAQCALAGVRAATVVSSGFGEGAAGESGRRRHADLMEILAGTDMRLLGPNTTGVLNLWDNYVPRAAYNHLAPESLQAGPIALVTQSGACSNIVFNRAQAAGVAIGCVVTTGAQADLSIWDIGAALLTDRRVSVVLLVAEDMADVAGLEDLAQTAHREGKTVVLLKLGQTTAGGAAVLAHSASLAGDARVQRAACRSLGILWAADFDALWELAQLAHLWGPAQVDQPRLGVLAFSGGEGALVADAASRVGLALPPPGERLRAVVAKEFAFADATNPFDPSGEVIGKPDLLSDAVREFARDDSYTEILIASPIFGPALASKLYPPVADAVSESPARIVLSAWHVAGLSEGQRKTLMSWGRPLFDSSVRAVQAIAAYYDVRRPGAGAQTLPPVPSPTSAPLRPDSSYWSVREALRAAGIEFTAARRCDSESEAAAAASEIGVPVVLKADVASSAHKSARGLVILGLRSGATVRDAYRRLHDLTGRAVVVEAQTGGELQLFVGIHRDPHFGPALVLGSGGITVERLADTALVVLRYARHDDVLAALGRTAAGQVIIERSPSVAQRLAELAQSLVSWFSGQPNLASVEINPAFVNLQSSRITCVDARVQ